MKKQVILNGEPLHYYIYDDGRVYTTLRKKFMTPSTSNSGYLRIKVFDTNGKPKLVFVHRLVAEAFIPNPDNKPQVNHIDGNKKNNTVENLEWVTAQENSVHAFNTGLRHGRKGKDCAATKWPEETIIRICELLSENKYTDKEIAQITNTNRALVISIRMGTTWAHISSRYPNIRARKDTCRFVKFHDYVDGMILAKKPKAFIFDKLMKEGLTKREAYNLVNGRIRNNRKLRKAYIETNLGPLVIKVN
jgi:hypothetical protein